MNIEVAFKNKNVLVTGGAGFIGSHIAKYLVQCGANVRVIDNLINGFRSNIASLESLPNFEFIEGDITDLAFCKMATKDMEFVSHQAALGSVPRSMLFPEKTNEINVTGFLNMLIAAKGNKVRKFVYASSSSVYGDEYTLPKIESKIGNPLSPYAVSKYTNELYAKVFASSFNMKILGFRYFNIFGPFQDPDGQYAAVIPIFISKILRNEPFYVNGDGKQTRDFTYVDNAVQANVKGLLCENEEAFGEVFNIAFGENYTLMDLVALLEKHLGLQATVLHREDRPGDIRDSLANIDKARSILGYHPSHSFEDGIIETTRFFKDKYTAGNQ